jgi:hypothetical protein
VTGTSPGCEPSVVGDASAASGDPAGRSPDGSANVTDEDESGVAEGAAERGCGCGWAGGDAPG